jgi:two-component system response regulator NreC
LSQALGYAARGAVFVSPSVSTSLAALEVDRPRSNVLDVLSGREREIFRLAVDCRTSPEIAKELCLARKTVDAHLNKINKKLGLRDRAELVRLAASIGLVQSIRSVVSVPPPASDGLRAHG